MLPKRVITHFPTEKQRIIQVKEILDENLKRSATCHLNDYLKSVDTLGIGIGASSQSVSWKL